MTNRDWKGERDWWLDQRSQWFPGARRRSNNPKLTASDYMGIPIPVNTPTPLAGPCLIWRWGLDSSGYGRLAGKGAHVVAYEQGYGKEVGRGLSILHLCHRPFCVQPAHLYEGTAKENSEDRNAVGSELLTYRTFEILGNRWDQAWAGDPWNAPPLEGASFSLLPRQPLKCPHRFIRPAGDAKLCANCGESNLWSKFWWMQRALQQSV